jgi:signal transduction histidine kinase
MSAVIVVGSALALSSVLLVTELRHQHMNGVDQALRIELASVSTLASGGALPQQLQITSQESSLIQVVNAKGRVIASSANLVGERRISVAMPGRAITFFTVDNLPIGSGSRYRIAVANVVTPSGRVVTYVGESLLVIDQSTHDVVLGLIFADPVLLLVMGLTVWWLVGRALHPVEDIRNEVEAISASELTRRVAEPVVHDEIGRLAITMNHMLDRLERASERQKTFVADASHELKSPLAAAQTELEVSLAHGSSSDWPESARIALGELERVRRIIDDLLVFAKFDERHLASVPRRVDLEEIVMDQCARVRRLYPVVVDTSRVSGARVTGDAEQLGRVVRNLLDNAQQHAHHQISVVLSETRGFAELVISDDGPGVKPEDRSRIFERFVRSDDARSRSDGGSGLGLAIVSEILQAHHGTIEVTDAGPGACLTVRLPVST